MKKSRKKYFYISRRRISIKHRWIKKMKVLFNSNRKEFLKFLVFWPDTFRLLINKIMIHKVIGLSKSCHLFILNRFF